MKQFLIPVVFALCSAMSLQGATITWTNVSGNEYQNSAQNPCVIYGPGNCEDADGWEEVGDTQLDFNLTTGNQITFAELQAALGAGPTGAVSFLLGIDLNQTNDPQTNLSVQVLLDGAVLYEGSLASAATNNQGTGYADLIGSAAFDPITGFTPLVIGPSAADAIVEFRFALNSNDGPDQLFLIQQGGGGTGNEVPEPGTWAMLAGGLGAMVIARRRG